MPLDSPIAYLLNQYPSISHRFFYDEVRALRRAGINIRTASVNLPAKQHPLTGETRAEADGTFYIKATSKFRALGFCLKTLFTRPVLFFRGLYSAISVESLSPRRILLASFYFAEALLLGEWMEQNKLRHLHIHFGGAVASVGRIAAAAYGFPYSLTIHGPDEFSDEALFHLREKVMNASFVVCISDFTRSQIMRLLGPEQWEKLHVIRMGVDPDMFVPRPARSFASPIELVCVGQFTPSKGHILLLQAMHDLIQKGHHLRLTLVGDGPCRNLLQKFVRTNGLADSVHFADPVTHEEIQAYLAQADIFVLPSLADGLPVALMEAMASQLPCVSTYVGGIPELITNEVDGLLVSSSSIEKLTEALELLASDPRLRGRLGEAARKKVLADYRANTNAIELARLFAELVPKAQTNHAKAATEATLA